jgi:hypothetical protein
MIDDDLPIDEDLTRRLRNLADTTTLDPGAWETIVARTSGTGGRVGAAPGVTTTAPAVPGQTPVEVTLRVEYADGTQEEVGVVGLPPAIELLGVTDLDGDGREEVAWITDAGAHSRIGGFVGTTGTGSLHVVGYAEPEVLYDGAALEVLGFACPDLDGDGRNEMVVTDYYAAGVDEAQLTVWTYRWSGDRLQQIDQDEERVPIVDADGDGVDDRRTEIRGPHCGDLHAVS